MQFSSTLQTGSFQNGLLFTVKGFPKTTHLGSIPTAYTENRPHVRLEDNLTDVNLTGKDWQKTENWRKRKYFGGVNRYYLNCCCSLPALTIFSSKYWCQISNIARNKQKFYLKKEINRGISLFVRWCRQSWDFLFAVVVGEAFFIKYIWMICQKIEAQTEGWYLLNLMLNE